MTMVKNSQGRQRPLLEVAGLRLSFSQYGRLFGRRTTTVLHGVDLGIYPGEVLAVVGESGAGKSVLADAILGLLPRNAEVAGQTTYQGEPLNSQQRRGADIRYVPQGVSNIDPTMKVERFVSRDGQPAGPRLERFDIGEELWGRYPHELSGGQLRRVLLATSIAEELKLLIADEPTPGLHKAATEQVLGYFDELRARGVAVLLITHDRVTAARIADRMVVLKDGSIDAIFPPHATGQLTGYSEQLWRVQPANEFWDAVADLEERGR